MTTALEIAERVIARAAGRPPNIAEIVLMTIQELDWLGHLDLVEVAAHQSVSDAPESGDAVPGPTISENREEGRTG